VKTKKAFPIFLSFLAIASIASTAVLGNTQTAYAGGVCTVDPNTFDFGLISDALIEVPKTIDCFDVITDVVIDTSDCDAKGISVFFPGVVAINAGVWTGDETAIPAGAPIGIEVQCDVKFEVTHNNSVDILTQKISITPEKDPFLCIVFPNDPSCKVGGEFLPIDSTALLLAGLQTSAIWMLPVLAGAAGAGFAAFKLRRK